MKLLFVKNASLLREGMIELFKRKFAGIEVLCCDQSNYHEYLDEDKLSDLLILDIHTDVDKDKMIECYRTNNKKVIVWTEDQTSKEINHLFALGLDGYFYYTMEEKELTQAIELVLADGNFVHTALAANLLEEYVRTQTKQSVRPLGLLSKREWEVLQLLSKGYNNVDIANSLYLSDKTIKNYVSAILRKLEVPDRTNAVLKALEEKWVYL